MIQFSSRRSSNRTLSLLILGLLTSLSACQSAGETWVTSVSPAEALLARSVEYHDPKASWGEVPLHLTWTSTRPSGAVSYAYDIEFTPAGDFLMHGKRRGHQLEYMVVGGKAHIRVDGDPSPSEELRKQMVVGKGNELFWRNYTGFLGTCPMNLPHAEAYIHPAVAKTTLDGQRVHAFDVTFEPEAGRETYTFYFEPKSARLVGLRFYRDDPKLDGETILFEGESQVGQYLLPKNRRWYTNKDNRLLGMDVLTAW